MWDTMNIKIKYKLPKNNVNDIVLVFLWKGAQTFLRIVTVTQLLPSKDSEIRGAIVRITNINTILKHPIYKLFMTENTYHDTN